MVRLHSAIPPDPRTVREKRHVSLDLDPVCPFGQDCHARQGDRKSAAYHGEGLVRCAVNLGSRQTGIVGIEEHIETIGRSVEKEVSPIRVYRLHIPSLACGNNEVIREIRTKSGEVGERRGKSTDC